MWWLGSPSHDHHLMITWVLSLSSSCSTLDNTCQLSDPSMWSGCDSVPQSLLTRWWRWLSDTRLPDCWYLMPGDLLSSCILSSQNISETMWKLGNLIIGKLIFWMYFENKQLIKQINASGKFVIDWLYSFISDFRVDHLLPQLIRIYLIAARLRNDRIQAGVSLPHHLPPLIIHQAPHTGGSYVNTNHILGLLTHLLRDFSGN